MHRFKTITSPCNGYCFNHVDEFMHPLQDLSARRTLCAPEPGDHIEKRCFYYTNLTASVGRRRALHQIAPAHVGLLFSRVLHLPNSPPTLAGPRGPGPSGGRVAA